MDEELLTRIKNTLLVILKTREDVTSVAVLGAATAWEVVPVEGDYRDEDELWGARIFLPAESYARMPDQDRARVEKTVCETLKEVTRSQSHAFCWIQIVPQLVEHLSETQAELVRWVRDTWPKELARQNVETTRSDDEIPF
jgi:hypothetical protein